MSVERETGSEGKWGPSQWRLKHSGLSYDQTLNITKATKYCHFKQQLDARVCQLQHHPAVLKHRSKWDPQGEFVLVHSRPLNALLPEKLSSAHCRGRAKFDSCQGTLMGTWNLRLES